MQKSFEEVMALQLAYSSENTPEMARRGALIRHTIPNELMSLSVQLRAALGDVGDDSAAEGRDGTGRKTFVPWVRWHSRSRSPSAQRGWYLVYLFHL